MVKPNIKAALNAFNDSYFKTEDFMVESNDRIINKSINLFLGMGPKCNLDKNNLLKTFQTGGRFLCRTWDNLEKRNNHIR